MYFPLINPSSKTKSPNYAPTQTQEEPREEPTDTLLARLVCCSPYLGAANLSCGVGLTIAAAVTQASGLPLAAYALGAFLGDCVGIGCCFLPKCVDADN